MEASLHLQTDSMFSGILSSKNTSVSSHRSKSSCFVAHWPRSILFSKSEIKRVLRNTWFCSPLPRPYPVWSLYREDPGRLDAILWNTPEAASKNALLFSFLRWYHRICSKYNSFFVRPESNTSVYPQSGLWDGLVETQKQIDFFIPGQDRCIQRRHNFRLFKRYSKVRCWVWLVICFCGFPWPYWEEGCWMTFQIFLRSRDPFSICEVRSRSSLWIVCWGAIIWSGSWWVVDRRCGSCGCRGPS